MHPLLTPILGDRPPSFAILHRPASGPVADVLIGDVASFETLAALPMDGTVLALVPFRQLAERGFDVIDDGTPLLGLVVRQRVQLPLAELIDALPADAGPFTETGYDVPDERYRQIVTDVLTGEIAAGEGSNFVIHRSVTGQVALPPARAALGALRQLLTRERDAYWTFAVHTPSVTLVGATPERHVTVDGDVVSMNPISGTLRTPPGGWSDESARQEALLAFLADGKERDELWMVLDEELKMMAQVADLGGSVNGPYLKQMSQLVHTEYVLAGQTSLDVRDVLRWTMFAPTVTGSPIRNACRVIAKHEGRGRGYYAGVLALLDHDEHGRQRLDAPILIRTAHISPSGSVRIPAGATLVRGSSPEGELAETRTKAAAILGAFAGPAVPNVHDHGQDASVIMQSRDPDDRVAAALAGRNQTLAQFWLQAQSERGECGHFRDGSPGVSGESARTRITVVDAEDDFTAMLAHVLRSLGLRVDVVAWQEVSGELAAAEHPVLLGPGPGDPAGLSCERIAVLHRIAAARLEAGLPTLGICLGHQVLGLELGLTIQRLPVPDQGVQQQVPVFGRTRTAGFYNSFVLTPPSGAGRITAESLDDRVVTLRGPGVTSLQFHPESVLTTQGREILAEMVDSVVTYATVASGA